MSVRFELEKGPRSVDEELHIFVAMQWLWHELHKLIDLYHRLGSLQTTVKTRIIITKNEIIQIIDENKELKNKTLLINIFPRTDGCAGRTVKINILWHTCQCCRSFRIGMKHVMFQETTAETHDCGHRWNTSQMKHMCQRHFTWHPSTFYGSKTGSIWEKTNLDPVQIKEIILEPHFTTVTTANVVDFLNFL